MAQQASHNPPYNLHVGCGKGRIESWINCDLYPGETTDLTFDVQQRWPFPDESVQYIYASHLLEHLTDFTTFFNEACRVMLPHGQLLIRTPYGLSTMAWADPSHVRPWFPFSFCHLQPGYSDAVLSNQYDKPQARFFVVDTILMISPALARWYRGPLKRFIWGLALHWPNVATELWVALMKPTADERLPHSANIVPMCLGYKTPQNGQSPEAGALIDVTRLPPPTHYGRLSIVKVP